ncbi:TNF receptor-associated factor homolog 1a-like isoform X1 [Solanum verrucosum]|uniref:TNF receptor-associated factor homolog 1a-like isoform X1 n=2 Tax=Solanum verrucosum TaxID=315347 RepID=UPI0020D07119|nr:TNF receptor-associated factor homolog 1a-like isoform X1 [Solanum verrucosum]XP_049373160.1 TNF receptor-associated factor homolog 1a-like isoform X1 [Solanum verrucosum]
MASSASEEAGIGKSLEEVSKGQQRCQSSETLAEWRYCEQMENGTPSTSPPYWDSDDDDDGGPKPVELFGKYTWKIDKFSQINKRELRSNTFEVGGYKWYVLIYPQGCDVCNHLSLFLCVANHDMLLPGWSHFAQFTIAVVNKDPKKSKYSDTLHRFWKKEHDWGWKKFMDLSKVVDGFLDSDTLIIKAQVQVIREKAERPFHSLDCQYRRELVRVYLTNVEQTCRRFVEERRGKLGKLIGDKARWSSFCAFWLGIDQNSRRRMSREKSDRILKMVVKNFFIEKEVTSTLVMDSLYSGLKALVDQSNGQTGKGKHLDAVEQTVPIVYLEKDMFVLVDDVLLLLERAVLEPLPPKDEKGPQNRTKDAASGEDTNRDPIQRDERRLTELGRRTIEIFVLAHIFSKIEVAYKEAVALKRQEELIREEAAWLAEIEKKAKRASEKEKKSKKKQSKQKRNIRKAKDKERDEKPDVMVHDKTEVDGPIGEGNEYMAEVPGQVLGKSDVLEEVSDISDSIDSIIHPDSEDRNASPVNWDTDSSEVHPSVEAGCSRLIGLSASQNVIAGRISPSMMDDSSSTCSTDSIVSVVINGTHRGFPLIQKNQKLPSRGRNERRRSTCKAADWASETLGQTSDVVSDDGQISDTSVSCGATGSECQATALPSCEQQATNKKVAVLQQRNLIDDRERSSILKPSVQFPSRTPQKSTVSDVQSKENLKISVPSDPILVKSSFSDSPKLTDKSGPVVVSAETSVMLKADPHKAVEVKPLKKPLLQPASISTEKSLSKQVTTSATAERSISRQVPAQSRPLSAPLVTDPRPASPVVSMVQVTQLLPRSVSAAGRLGPDPSPATHSYVPQSYRNAIMGSLVSGSPVGFSQPHSPSSAVNSPHPYSQSPSLTSGLMLSPEDPERTEHRSAGPSFSYGMANEDTSWNGQKWESSASYSRSVSHPFVLNDIQESDMLKPVNSRTHDHLPSELPACTSGCQSQSVLADEFPHLDIINDLLNDENGIGRASEPNSGWQRYSNHLNHQFSYPGDIGMATDLGPSARSCRFERTRSYHDELQHYYSGGLYNSIRNMIPQPNPQFVNGQIDQLVHDQWQLMHSDPSFLGMRNGHTDTGYLYHTPDYSNMACGVNRYRVFRPSNGF